MFHAILTWNSNYFRKQYQVVSLWKKTPSVHYSIGGVNFIILGCVRSQSKWYISKENSCRTECLSCMSHQNYLPNFRQNDALPTRSKFLHKAAFQNKKTQNKYSTCVQRTFARRTSECALAGDIHSSRFSDLPVRVLCSTLPYYYLLFASVYYFLITWLMFLILFFIFVFCFVCLFSVCVSGSLSPRHGASSGCG